MNWEPCRMVVVAIVGLSIGWWISPLLREPAASDHHLNTGTAPSSLLGSRQTSATKGPSEAGWDVDLPEYLNLRQLAGRADPRSTATFSADLGKVFEVSDYRQRDMLVNNLFRRWVALNPTEAFTACRGLRDKGQRRFALIAWARQWVQSDLDGCLAQVHALIGEDERDLVGPVLEGLTAAMGHRRPREALALMARYGHYTSAGFAAVAKVAPHEAATFLRDQMGTKGVEGFASSVFDVWVADQPDEAIRFYEGLQLSPAEKKAYVRALSSALERVDPRGAIEFLAAEGVLEKNAARIGGNWASREPREAADWALTLLGERLRERVLDQVLPRLGSKDPVAAYELMMQEPGGASSKATPIFKSWVTEDWEAATAAALELEPKLQAHALEGLLPYLADQQPEYFREHLDTFLEHARASGERIDLSDAFMHMEDHEVAELAEAYPELLDRSVRELLESKGWRDPHAAARLAMALPDSPGRDRGVQQAVHRMARSEPHEAAALVQGMTAGEGQTVAFQNLVNTWSRYDRQGARDWIESLQPGEARDIVVEEFIRSNVGLDGEVAWDLTGLAGDAEQRLAMRRLALEGWAEHDPAAARQAMERLDDPPEELEATLEKVLESNAAWEALFNPGSAER